MDTVVIVVVVEEDTNHINLVIITDHLLILPRTWTLIFQTTNKVVVSIDLQEVIEVEDGNRIMPVNRMTNQVKDEAGVLIGIVVKDLGTIIDGRRERSYFLSSSSLSVSLSLSLSTTRWLDGRTGSYWSFSRCAWLCTTCVLFLLPPLVLTLSWFHVHWIRF